MFRGGCGQRHHCQRRRCAGRLAAGNSGVACARDDENAYGGAVDESFSAQLWESISDIYGAILAHPFVTGLTDGTLPEEAFAFYVVQDALYLREYARALAAVGSRAPT